MGIYVVSGRPRSGKTAYVTNWAIRDLKRGRPVYSTYPIVFKTRRYVYKSLLITREDVKKGLYPYGSLIIFDEANHDFNARNFKQFDENDLTFFTQGSHLGLDLVLISQHPQRIDISIREIPEYFLEVKKIPLTKICLVYYYDLLQKYGKREESYRMGFFRHKFKTHMAYDSEYYRKTFEGRELQLKDHEGIDQMIDGVLSTTLLREYFKSKREKFLDFTRGKYRRKNDEIEFFEKRKSEYCVLEKCDPVEGGE